MGFSLGSVLPLSARLWIEMIPFGSGEPKRVRFSWHRLNKGPCHPSELEAMQYVASHTSVRCRPAKGVP
jgi:hypothetical protein